MTEDRVAEHRARLDATAPLDCWRNTLARALCNWILWHIATPKYRHRIDLFARLGMERFYTDCRDLAAQLAEPPESAP